MLNKNINFIINIKLLMYTNFKFNFKDNKITQVNYYINYLIFN